MKRLKIKKIAWKDFVFAKRHGSQAEKRSSIDYLAFKEEKARLNRTRIKRTVVTSHSELAREVL